MDAWQPIATAPRDATQIDLWLRVHASPRSFGMGDAFRVTDAWWQESTKEWVHMYSGSPEALYGDYITHWMPIPAGPVGVGATGPSMRVSLPGLLANVVGDLPRREQAHYRFALNEVLTHLRETIAGEHTLDEFAEFYCLKDRATSEAPRTPDGTVG